MRQRTTPSSEAPPLYCSFCGKSAAEVRKLIAGATVCICDECVDLCVDIIAVDHRGMVSSSGSEARPPPEPQSPETVYVPYLNGAGDGWTTALAVRLADGNYRIEGGLPDSPRVQFSVGTIVRCALIVSPDGETALAAIEAAKPR